MMIRNLVKSHNMGAEGHFAGFLLQESLSLKTWSAIWGVIGILKQYLCAYQSFCNWQVKNLKVILRLY